MSPNLEIFLLLGSISAFAFGGLGVVFTSIFGTARTMFAGWLFGGLFGYAITGAAWIAHAGIFAERFGS